MMVFDRNKISEREQYELFTCEQVRELLIKRKKLIPNQVIAAEINKTDNTCIVTWYYENNCTITAYDISSCYDTGVHGGKTASLLHDLKMFEFTFMHSLWSLTTAIENPTLNHIVITKNPADIKF